MQNHLTDEAPIIKGDNYVVSQSPKTDLEKDSVKVILYASAIGS